MSGSTIDGEDIVQETIVRALDALPSMGAINNPGGWLFRIAYNASLDFLRRRKREPLVKDDDVSEIAEEVPEVDSDIAEASLRTFLRLAALQRSAVILKDVLGHSVEEVAAITGVSAMAAKSALQRGRVRLRELALEPQDVMLPMLSDVLRARLSAYVEGFRTGDFDAVRAMLAEEVQLDLVDKLQRRGRREVGEYLGRYAAAVQWEYAAGVVEGRAAMLVYDKNVSLESPAYFVVLTFEDGMVASIRDFLFARHAMDGVEMMVLSAPSSGHGTEL